MGRWLVYVHTFRIFPLISSITGYMALRHSFSSIRKSHAAGRSNSKRSPYTVCKLE
ncbi:hypothetical protein K450DRAFT_225672 [Umbelopsis ramanniana AG]|uniref:Uncharacterized protein n=1 Tax=Umbelopsis ramanniana AG TaxID=1314678 RepID=A0AAD5EGU7_UMBRA|nr:uncharacterized protein K450DRAFT_225672 [Umbelopsis ramanniana AG]KAI8582964.1 hypothetical protein K450DRAFT_225672 [Umbelopsis ramanniana AG]